MGTYTGGFMLGATATTRSIRVSKGNSSLVDPRDRLLLRELKGSRPMGAENVCGAVGACHDIQPFRARQLRRLPSLAVLSIEYGGSCYFRLVSQYGGSPNDFFMKSMKRRTLAGRNFRSG